MISSDHWGGATSNNIEFAANLLQSYFYSLKIKKIHKNMTIVVLDAYDSD
jgi:hypothetical protein